MILQALTEYYARKLEEGEGAVAPFGFEHKEIPFLIVLDEKGRFVDLEDTRVGSGQQRRGRKFLVPQAKKRSRAVDPNLLWDNPGYVLGVSSTGDGERVVEQHQRFVEAVRALHSQVEDHAALGAVVRFLERQSFDALYQHELWPEIEAESGPNLSFRIEGQKNLVCQDPAVQRAVAQLARQRGAQAEVCLVTGNHERVARLHPSVKGLPGASTFGASLVSFNLDAARSRGHAQGYNAPVATRAAFAYTTALSFLLRPSSLQQLQLGRISLVFWAEDEHPLEASFPTLLGELPPDSPQSTAHRGTDVGQVGSTNAERAGASRFYVLGLSPNRARAAVRFWHETTVHQLAHHLGRYREDLQIVHAPFEPDLPSFQSVLRATAVLGAWDNVKPSVTTGLISAAVTGDPLSHELLATAVQRNRKEQAVPYARAALIKAWLRRDAPRDREHEVGTELDPQNRNMAYRLGRLLAVIDRVQVETQRTAQSTIGNRFYGMASTGPASVFPWLLRRNQQALREIRGPGRAAYFRQLVERILDSPATFPAHLSLVDQARFSIGYYHQRHVFFTVPETSDSGNP